MGVRDGSVAPATPPLDFRSNPAAREMTVPCPLRGTRQNPAYEEQDTETAREISAAFAYEEESFQPFLMLLFRSSALPKIIKKWYTVTMSQTHYEAASDSPNPLERSQDAAQSNVRVRVSDAITGVFKGIWASFSKPPESKKEIPLLPEQLTGKEVLEWAKRNGVGTSRMAEAGTLIEQGQESKAVYVITGRGAQAEQIVDGKTFYLAQIPTGSVVGEISALGGGVATATVKLPWATEIFEIPKDDFESITKDVDLGMRIQELVKKRLLMTADFKSRLETYLEERNLERMHETPNAELERELNFANAMRDGLAEGKKVTHTFPLSFMIENRLGTKNLTVDFTKQSRDFKAHVHGDGVSINVDFSEDGTCVSGLNSRIREGQGGGIYTRVLRYLLRGVEYIHSSIVEDNTMSFVWDRRGRSENIAHSELAARSPVVAARKGFISNIDRGGALDSYRTDQILTLALDVATDLERSLLDGDDRRLKELYGTTQLETLSQLIDIINEYRESPEYAALSDDVRRLCDLQADRIGEIANEL